MAIKNTILFQELESGYYWVKKRKYVKGLEYGLLL